MNTIYLPYIKEKYTLCISSYSLRETGKKLSVYEQNIFATHLSRVQFYGDFHTARGGRARGKDWEALTALELTGIP